MSLFKPHGSKYWYYDFAVKGVRHYGSTGTASKEAAKEVEAAQRELVRRAAFFPDEKKKPQMTVKAAFDRYYVEVSGHLASADNHLTYMERLLTLGADRYLADITDSDVAHLVAKRRATKARYSRDPVSNATVNRETELLSRIFRRARKVWKVDVGDQIDWSAHRLPEVDERIRELTADEESRLFAHLRADYQPMVRFALISGMRLSNLVRLTWRQVDLSSGQITLKMKSRKPGGRSHTIPITPGMIALLTAEKGHHPIYVFTYVCAKSREKRRKGRRYPFSHDGWRRAWWDALQKAEIEDFRFHDIRHTAATRIVRASGNLKVAQKLLGHTDISATTRYAHVTKDDVLNALILVESQEIPKGEGTKAPTKGKNVQEEQGASQNCPACSQS